MGQANVQTGGIKDTRLLNSGISVKFRHSLVCPVKQHPEILEV